MIFLPAVFAYFLCILVWGLLMPRYIGTGTQAGDPREAAAIYESFGRHIPASETPLYVGSVKTVIGERSSILADV